MMSELTNEKSIWIAHESIGYAHGHCHIRSGKLKYVNYAVTPVNYLSSVLGCELVFHVKHGTTYYVAVVIAKIISTGMIDFILHHSAENIDI
jgi:hypothetical protein